MVGRRVLVGAAGEYEIGNELCRQVMLPRVFIGCSCYNAGVLIWCHHGDVFVWYGLRSISR